MPSTPIRILTAVPVCDGHDSAISTIDLECVRQGIEVVYLGYHRTAADIVRAAIQEDVRGVGISSYNGGHVEFFAEVVDGLRVRGAGHIGVFGGGGGTITPADAQVMRERGVDRIFFAGTPLSEITRYIVSTYGQPRWPVGGQVCGDLALARRLTAVEEDPEGERPSEGVPERTSGGVRVIGVTGPGGAGKTTLIDELVLRALRADPTTRIAILSHDPSIMGKGALLGDRAAMIYCQADRVFLRSLATRGQAGGLSRATERCIRLLRGMGDARHGGFDLIIVETVGTGQEASPFGTGVVDQTVLVMSPDYGSRLQLQKIVMLDVANVIVVNKSDLAGAPAAAAELEERLHCAGGGNVQRRPICTIAKRHGDAGVDELFRAVVPGGASVSGADDGQPSGDQQGGGVLQPVRGAAGRSRSQGRGVRGADPGPLGEGARTDPDGAHTDRPRAPAPGAASDR
jgi:methylmalonyl-CoA mutase